jgi:CMP-N-acetylneuraminic acid synthetase
MIYENNKQVINNNYKNRQSHKTIYIYNGAYYVYNLHKYNSNEKVFIKYIMKKEEGYDLDDETDLKIISLLLK